MIARNWRRIAFYGNIGSSSNILEIT